MISTSTQHSIWFQNRFIAASQFVILPVCSTICPYISCVYDAAFLHLFVENDRAVVDVWGLHSLQS